MHAWDGKDIGVGRQELIQGDLARIAAVGIDDSIAHSSGSEGPPLHHWSRAALMQPLERQAPGQQWWPFRGPAPHSYEHDELKIKHTNSQSLPHTGRFIPWLGAVIELKSKKLEQLIDR